MDIHNQLDHSRQFVIKGAGTDPETYGHLSYLPPDTTYTSSIRLGNYCGYHGAERLTYDFYVTPENSFLTFWYALSMQNGMHASQDSPEFVVVIKSQQGGTWQPAAGDTLCAVRVTPSGDSADTAFRFGTTGEVYDLSFSHYGENIYLPWQTMSVDLTRWNYQQIRIEVSSGDCSLSAHYGLAYFAASCQAPSIESDSVPPTANDVAATIHAPQGASGYHWYRGRHGHQSKEGEGDSDYVLIPDETSRTINLTVEHFIDEQTGDTLVQNDFKCIYTTSLNEAIPIQSELYATVGRVKPYQRFDSIVDCSNSVTLHDLSVTPYVPDETYWTDTSLTYWQFYTSAEPTDSTLAATITGGTASHTFDRPGHYSLRVTTTNASQSLMSTSEMPIRVFSAPLPSVEISPAEVQAGSEVVLTDLTPRSERRIWTFYEAGGERSVETDSETIEYVAEATTAFRLWTSGAMNEGDTNGDHIEEAFYCPAVLDSVIKVSPVTVQGVEGEDIVVYVQGRAVYVSGAEGRAVRLLDVCGRVLSRVRVESTRYVLSVPSAGVYLVQIEGFPARKIVVSR